LAWRGKKEILTHPDVDKTKDENGRTPKDILKMRGFIQ